MGPWRGSLSRKQETQCPFSSVIETNNYCLSQNLPASTSSPRKKVPWFWSQLGFLELQLDR